MPWHTSPVFTSPQNHRATPWYFSPKRYRQQQKRYCKKQPRQRCLACYPPTAAAGGAKVPAGKKMPCIACTAFLSTLSAACRPPSGRTNYPPLGPAVPAGRHSHRYAGPGCPAPHPRQNIRRGTALGTSQNPPTSAWAAPR